jgi:hypothetical protein
MKKIIKISLATIMLFVISVILKNNTGDINQSDTVYADVVGAGDAGVGGGSDGSNGGSGASADGTNDGGTCGGVD